MRKYKIGAIVCLVIAAYLIDNTISELAIPTLVLLWYCVYKLARYERTN